MYQVTETNSTRRQLVRYMLSAHELAPEQVVGRAIEALIYRDERYAHSFFRYDPGYLKGTSPRQVGYTILNKSVDSKGKAVVAAAIDYSYQDPYYAVEKKQFTLTKSKDGYKIDEMKEMGSIRIADWSGEIVTTTEADQKGDLIFKLEQVPQDDGWKNEGFANLVYRESASGKKIWFLVKQRQGEQSRLRLMSYDWNQGSFEKFGWLAGAEHSSMMILDGNGERAAIDVTREDNRADIAILSIDGTDTAPVYLSDKLQGPNYEEMGTRLWDGSMLSFYIAVDGRDFFFKYNAAQ
ncbi:hypothetical protein [Paenibacillus profundus]|uniref:hypothetical protein n=1 Tax=Paenibacillus profundus TaxID=1173085 RepID=UPI001F4517AE|nr:hypothetical protein [Paenibacillus profundus]